MNNQRLKKILIIGGARGGKSHFAQEPALKSGGPVLFVATDEVTIQGSNVSPRPIPLPFSEVLTNSQ